MNFMKHYRVGNLRQKALKPFARMVVMTLVSLVCKKVSITEGGINNGLKKGSFAICCIDIDPV